MLEDLNCSVASTPPIKAEFELQCCTCSASQSEVVEGQAAVHRYKEAAEILGAPSHPMYPAVVNDETASPCRERGQPLGRGGSLGSTAALGVCALSPRQAQGQGCTHGRPLLVPAGVKRAAHGKSTALTLKVSPTTFGSPPRTVRESTLYLPGSLPACAARVCFCVIRVER